MPLYGRQISVMPFSNVQPNWMGGALVRRKIEEGAVMGSAPRGRWTPEATLVAAKKWTDVFGTPMATIMSIVDIESAHSPDKVNMARADKGGAWGLGQQMLDEAPEKIARIVHQYGKMFPEVRATARKWKGRAENLLDPDLNLMLSAWQLGRLHQQFGDFPTVAAAYHQGAGAVRQRLASGRPAVSRIQPLGMAYVAMANQAKAKYAPLIYAFAY